MTTRHAIDRAATGLFFRLGYHATSMRAIGNDAHVQSAAIYHWYPNKEALLVHLQDEFMRRLTDVVESAVAAQVHPVHRLAAAVREHVVFHGLHQQEAFVTDSEIRALTPGPRRALMARRDAYQQNFLAMIEAGVLQGHFASGNPRVATYAILLQCTGVSAWFKASGVMTIDEVADHHVDLVLGSLHTDPGLIASALAATRAT
ncbi:TetR/AcrR family transcriptional regulator [Streptomyces gramineus]|uniref:TetR/AcrR family transcriptional regulator n=1 Tax=Streptomyces gramineus TaxID=910542 RepID=UPI00398AFA18